MIQQSRGPRSWSLSSRSAFALYLLRRLLLLVIVVWAAATLMFFLPRLTGFNALEQRILMAERTDESSSEARKAAAELYRERFGFSRPLAVQYVRYMWNLARFDLGYSMAYYPVTVKEVLARSLPWTIGLLAVTTGVAFALGSIIGGVVGWSASTRWAAAAMTPLMALSAIPYYLLALLLVFVVAFRFGWFPLSGAYGIGVIPEFTWRFAGDVLYHAVLPAVSVVLGATGFWALSMRGMIVSVLSDDFMTMAEAKGLRRFRIFARYALRNALLPQVTGLALSLGTIFTGLILVEIVFRYPGVGDALQRAARRGDYFIVSGITYVTIVAIALATFIMDITYPLLDPRVSRGRRRR